MKLYQKLKMAFQKKTFFIWFLLIAALPLIIFTYLCYVIAKDVVYNETINNLSVIANGKQIDIERYLQTSKLQNALLSKNSGIINAVSDLEKFQSEKKFNDANHYTTQFTQYIRPYIEAANYKDLLLISTQGRILYSFANQNAVGKDLYDMPINNPYLKKIVQNSKTLLETIMSDFFIGRNNEDVSAYIASPIFDNEAMIGILAVKVPGNAIAKIVQDPEGLGDTGETILGKLRDHKIIPEIALRHQRIEDFLQKSINIHPSMIDAFENATQGQKGQGKIYGFDEEKLLAVWRYVPSLDAGMLITIDLDEAYEPIKLLQKEFIIIILIALLLVISAAYLVGNRLQKTENKLNATLEQLKVAMEQALEADKTKSIFLANMSHELRTPLNAIIGYSEMLSEDAVLEHNEALAKDLNKISAAGRHLLGLINDILDLSKIEAGRVEIFIEQINVNSFVQNLQDMIEPLMHKNNNTLIVKCQENIGSIESDLIKLKQCLYNLLSNATKFTNNGKITLEVYRENENSAEFIYFKITDTGIGISSEQLDRLFKAFTQADPSTTRKYGGTGLGLFITLNFTQMLGGIISVDSKSNLGSTFLIKLPVKSINNQNYQLDELNAKSGNNLHQKTVLIVDDDLKVHKVFQEILNKYQLTAIHASNGEEGIKLAGKVKPDLIILDAIMPKMDGWTMLNKIKADDKLREIPVIMVTVSTDSDLAYVLGVNDFLVKPVNETLLINTITKYLSNTRASVLVADDDPVTRTVIKSYLKRTSWTVFEAENGSDALEKIKSRKPDIILLDLMMPEMDGFKVVEILSKDSKWRDIPVIIITAKELTEQDREKLSVGVKTILNKGLYDRKRLIDTINKYLN